MYYLDGIITLSMLQIHWFLLVLCFIISVEAFIFNLFWKKWEKTLIISFVANIASVLITLPFLSFSPGAGSMWFQTINMASFIYEDGITIVYILGIMTCLLFFALAFLLSVIVEILVGKALNAPKSKIIRIFTFANLATYFCIVVSLIGLGIWFGLTNQDPHLRAWDFFEGKLIYNIPLDSTIILVQQFLFFTGIILVVIILILLLIHKYKGSSTNIELKNQFQQI